MTYFLYALTGSLSIYFSCINLLPNKPKLIKKLCSFLFTLFSFYFLFPHLGQFSTFFVLSWILFFIYYLNNKDFFSLSCALFGYLYAVSTNYIFLWVAQFLLKMNMKTMLLDNYLTSVFSCIYCLFCVITTWLIGRYLHSVLRLSSFFKQRQLSFAVFINLLILSFFFIFNFSYGEFLGYHYGIIALNGITFLLLFAITAFLMQYIYHFAAKEQYAKNRLEQFESLKTYTSNLEESYGIMRKFKHDYINILSTLSEYLKENDIEGLKVYYEEKILPISYAFTDSGTRLAALSYIKDSALKGLLSSKLIYAMETKIETRIEITEFIENIAIDILDLSRILGIFLDNAIEAAREVSDRELTLCIFYKEKNLHIIVQNTSVPPPFPIANLALQAVSSKGENRGMGLYQVSLILKDYFNINLRTEYKKNYFTQELIISSKE